MPLDTLNPLILFPVLALAVLVYYLLPAGFRWGFLLFASYAFYFLIGSWSIVVLIFITLVNYLLGLLLSREGNKHQRGLLFLGILANLALLFFFKYFTGILAGSSILATFVESAGGRIIAPVGLSFFTLQNISYLVDVSKGLLPAERNFGIFALYTAFFPKIMAGPIERARNLLPQLRALPAFDRQHGYTAVPLILTGLFKKVVIADRLALYIDKLFNEGGQHAGAPVWTGLIFLSFQIYLDFSGYTDLALGVANLFGIRLTPNFKRPYLAENIVEFWNRWHLSFSTWLRDYVFFPLRRYFTRLTGRGSSFLALVIPPLITMLASGVWHGTGWTYLLWGFYHAVFYIGVVAVRSLRGIAEKEAVWKHWVKMVLNFAVITFGWILFRSATLTDAWQMVTSLFKPSTSFFNIIQADFSLDFLLARVLIVLVVAVELLIEIRPERFALHRLPWWGRWLVYLFLLLCISIIGVYPEGGNPFVYFKF